MSPSCRHPNIQGLSPVKCIKAINTSIFIDRVQDIAAANLLQACQSMLSKNENASKRSYLSLERYGAGNCFAGGLCSTICSRQQEIVHHVASLWKRLLHAAVHSGRGVTTPDVPLTLS